ncbi:MULTISPECIES: RICIN domain-containing protein [Streptomyces]|uniref:RICIN domain-containing protein n=1 Tax=Streptomyces TaxID=1883 RepID=UPI00067B65F8|nr:MULTISPECIES: RICIN domain-containing protein [Streptomyces]
MARITRAALATAGMVAALAGGTTTAHAAGAAPAPVVETVQFQLAHTGKCLDASPYTAGDQTKVQQLSCNGSDAQKWRVVPAAESTFELRNVVSGRCLEVRRSQPQSGAEVWQWPCNGGKQQRWTFGLLDPINKLYEIRPTHTGDQCLDIGHAQDTEGAAIWQWKCNQGIAQQWRILTVK